MKRVTGFLAGLMLIAAHRDRPAAGRAKSWSCYGVAAQLRGHQGRSHCRGGANAGGGLRPEAWPAARSSYVRPTLSPRSCRSIWYMLSREGAANPVAGKNLEQELKTKPEFVKVLADSFAFCDDVFSSTTDENALQFVRQGPNELTRASILYGLLAHNAEMYGIGTVYLRLKGIVPPSTERQAKGRGGKAGRSRIHLAANCARRKATRRLLLSTILAMVASSGESSRGDSAARE